MKGHSIVLALVGAICVTALPLPATASVGVNDPGFSYVDVNNDGLYNPADGDIGVASTPSVNIDALIINDGHFDTSQSEGNYNAPCYPVSLVISHTMEIPLTVPISLKAGVDLIDYGHLVTTNSTITLQACRNIVLAPLSTSDFGTQMTVNAGQDVFLDGAIILGENSSSKLYVSAGRDISAQIVAFDPTTISVGNLVSFCSGRDMTLDGAAITTTQTTPGSSVSLVANGALEALDRTSISTLTEGDVVAKSQCSLVNPDSAVIDGTTLQVCADTSADVASALIFTTGATTIQANGPVEGDSAIIEGSCVKVTSCDGVNLDSSNLVADSSSIQVTGQGDVSANNAFQWTAASEIDVTSTCGNIDAQTAEMTVLALPGPIKFYAGGRLIIVTGSTFTGTVTFGPHGVVVIGPFVDIP